MDLLGAINGTLISPYMLSVDCVCPNSTSCRSLVNETGYVCVKLAFALPSFLCSIPTVSTVSPAGRDKIPPDARRPKSFRVSLPEYEEDPIYGGRDWGYASVSTNGFTVPLVTAFRRATVSASGSEVSYRFLDQV